MTDLVIRPGVPSDADALLALIRRHQDEGHLLPRDLDEVRRRAAQFVVYESEGEVRACAELVPLSATVAEIRSLVVSPDVRRVGVAARLVGALTSRARSGGFRTLCAFTHDARFFVRHNFSIVPHVWLPEKIARDCATCPLFRQCGQLAMVLPLTEVVRYGPDVNNVRRMAVA